MEHNDRRDRLMKQIQFVLEIDKLKRIFRQTYLLDKSRKENDAEHSWHLAMMAILLYEYAAGSDVDLLRVLKMVLIHDIVEIDAGDTFCYDEEAAKTKDARERAAADRLFDILPPDQARELRDLWEEFEAAETPAARFAAALDRLQPMLQNYNTQGKSWREHGVTAKMVVERNRPVVQGAPPLWEYAEQMVLDAVEKNYVAPETD